MRWKIMAPFAITTLIFAVLGTFLVTRLVAGSLEERFTNQLVEAARVSSDSLVRRERQHLSVTRTVAFTEGVAAAAEGNDPGTMRRLVAPIAANSRAELVQVLDSRGNRLFGQRLNTATGEYLPVGDDTARQWPFVADVLAGRTDVSGDKFAGIVDTPDGPALYTAAPIKEGGRLSGVVLVGSLLDSFLPATKGEALADLTVFTDEGQPVATTFADGPTSLATLHRSTPPVSGLRERVSLFGRGYDQVYAPLLVRGERVGWFAVALPTDYIATAAGQARMEMSVLFAAITLAVLLIGWWISRQFTRPLAQLAHTADELSSGDLTARSGVRAGDEIGTLALTFNTMADRLERQHLSTIAALASAIDARDPHTAGHSVRVGQLAAEIGTSLGFRPAIVQHLKVGGYLHDIGKIGIRDSILLKPGTLTAEEREIIEQHPHIGLDILAPVDLPDEVIAFVAGHHERLNGSGYPLKLSSDEIATVPRIAAVCDVYDALTTDRPYREAMTVEEALRILQRESMEGLLDPEIVQTLRSISQAWEERRRTDPLLRGFRLSPRLMEPAA